MATTDGEGIKISESELHEIGQYLASKPIKRPPPKAAVDLLGLYHSGGPPSDSPWNTEFSFFKIEVNVDGSETFSISGDAQHTADVTSMRGIACLLHDIITNGWIEVFPRSDVPANITPLTMQVQKVDIVDDQTYYVGRAFNVYVQVLVHYTSYMMLGIRYEMDWKPAVISILKSNFRW